MAKGEQLTSAEYQELERQLAELEGPRMKEVVDAIAAARGFGDISENFEYQAAMDEQASLFNRIETLKARLLGAEVVRRPGRTTTAQIGTAVTIRTDSKETLKVSLSNVVKPGRQTASADSPLGKALIGAKVGEKVTVHAPRGAWTGTVKKIEKDV